MSRRVWLTVAGVVAITALLAVWALVVVWRALALVATGEAIGVLLGLAFLVLPLVALAMLAREWRLAIATQAMADELFAEGGLEIDELPRSPGGRIDKAAARDAFDAARTQAEAEPSDWRSWYRLAFAYDAAGDRGRARASLRKAARMRRG
ncbi:MAG: hypothetical protein FWD18_07690 [Micrococcales bacterium]|nr:hypothetical protein [Micrococcales bacterium]